MKTLRNLMTLLTITLLSTNVFGKDSLATNHQTQSRLKIENTDTESSVIVKKGSEVKIILHGGKKVTGKVNRIEKSFIWVGQTKCEISKIGKIKLRSETRKGTIKSVVAGVIIGSVVGVATYTGFAKGFGNFLIDSESNQIGSGSKFWGGQIFNEKDSNTSLTVETVPFNG